MNSAFNPADKEAALRQESESWDTTAPLPARDGDIPTVDVGPYFASGSATDLSGAADALRHASETVGFHQLVGHGIAREDIEEIFTQTRRFHALPLEQKSRVLMDRDDWPLKGCGYLPIGERKLPRRQKGNLNEAFIVKSDQGVGPNQNQWLPDEDLPGFRASVENFGRTVTNLALRLLPVYAVALDLPADFFAPGFTHPFSRLRLSHYPPVELTQVSDTSVASADSSGGEAYGIAPHVDTTFLTLLLQDGPGLTIFSHERDCWISAPVIDGAFVVNSGELLRQWSNDRFLSTRHFANNSEPRDRYSVPFFFNATSDYPMECLPTCHGPDNPPKYPTISYNESQAVVQGE